MSIQPSPCRRAWLAKTAAFDLWARQWKNNVWDCPALRKILPDLHDHPGFLLGINRLDKQLARIRMDYASLRGFLYRHKLSEHNFCDGCDAMYADNKVVQSAEHHLLACPIYKHQRKELFKTVNIALGFAPSFDLLSLSDFLRPAMNKHSTNIVVAGAVYDFITATAGRFL